MLPKPDGCKPCPAYSDGQGFCADTVVLGEVEIRGQAPGVDEEREGRPYVGKTGQLMDRVFLPLAGLVRERVTISNTFRCRWSINGKKTDQLPSGKGSKALLQSMMICCRQYDPPPPSKLYLAQGEWAWKSLGGPGTISEWRGNVLVGGSSRPAVLATLHLASLFKPHRVKR